MCVCGIISSSNINHFAAHLSPFIRLVAFRSVSRGEGHEGGGERRERASCAAERRDMGCKDYSYIRNIT